MTRDTNIRVAENGDHTLLMEMIRSFYEEDHHDYQEKRIIEAIREIIHNRNLGLVYLIESGGVVAGYFILTFGWSLEYFGKDVFIDEFYIREEYRRQGLGKRALEFIEDYVRKNQFRAIHLEVNKFNIARKLYESKGFISHNSDLMSKRFNLS